MSDKKPILTHGTPDIGRRSVLLGASAIAAATATGAITGFPAVHAQDRSVKIGVYGGYFKDSFDKHVFPEFTKASGIKVDSIAEPTGEAWVVQLEQAARAGQAPADINMMAQTSMLVGQKTKLWQVLDRKKMPNSDNVLERLVHTYEDGQVDGIGGVAWYITLCTNTETYKEAPTSWEFLWDEKNKDTLGLLALVSNSFLLEVTAKTYFGGYEILNDEEGILKVMAKLAEVRDNVRLWYRDEGQFQAALESGEIPAGQYYHDVAGLAAADGKPVRSTFPKEGGISDSGAWAVPRSSKKLEEAHVFIDFMCQPSMQSLMSRKVGTAPVVERSKLDLTDEEFSGVSSEIDPVVPQYDMLNSRKDWLAQKWSEVITAG